MKRPDQSMVLLDRDSSEIYDIDGRKHWKSRDKCPDYCNLIAEEMQLANRAHSYPP